MSNKRPSAGQLLRQYRDRRGWTQMRAAGAAGIDRWQTLSAYENDNPKRKPRKTHLVALAEVYGLSLPQKNELLLAANFAPEVDSSIDERHQNELREMMRRFPLAGREEQLEIAGRMRGICYNLRYGGELEGARDFLTQALILSQTLDRTSDEADTQYELANVYRELGDGKQAISLYRKARTGYRVLHEEGWERQVLQLRMEIARMVAIAGRHVHWCVAVGEYCIATLAEREEMEGWEYRCLLMGEIYQLAGDLKSAERLTKRSLEASQLSFPGWYATNLVRMGEIMFAAKRQEEAIKLLDEASHVYYTQGWPRRARMVEETIERLRQRGVHQDWQRL